MTLGILETIGRRSDVTQRHLAGQLGVALGLANSYLRRCIRKGLVKVTTAPANRYAYYLTPHGFAEKSRLTAKYLSVSFDFYRRASASCSDVYRQCRAAGWSEVVLCGASELAEVASVRAHDAEVRVVGVFDPRARSDRFVGLPLHAQFSSLPPFDVAVLTALEEPHGLYRELTGRLPPARVLVPSVLGFAAAEAPHQPEAEPAAGENIHQD